MSDQPQNPGYVPRIEFPAELNEISGNPAYDIIQADIRNAINAGLGVEATINTYRAAGLSFTDSKIRQMYHDETALIADQGGTAALSLQDEMSPRHDPYGPAFAKDTRYLYELTVTVYDKDRNEFYQEPQYLYSQDVLTVQQAIDQIYTRINDNPEGKKYKFQVVTGSVFGAFLNPKLA